MGRLSEIPQECLQKSKNASFYRRIGRNRWFILINDYDEMVHRGPFQLNRNRRIAMDDPDEAFKRYVIKHI